MNKRDAKRPKPKKAKKPKKRAAEKEQLLDVRFAEAVAHWIRVNILAVASWREISASEFARETGLKLSQVSYHFKRLVDLDALELVRQEQVRGAMKSYYRGTRQALFDGAGWTELPKSIQDGVAGAALQDFTRISVRAFEQGTFSGRDDSHLTWEPVIYDELAYKAMVKILMSTRARLLALQDEAAPRLQRTGNDGILVAIALAGFEMAKPEGD